MAVHMSGKTEELLEGGNGLPGIGQIAKQMEDAYRILGPALRVLIDQCKKTKAGRVALQKYDDARDKILKDLVR